MQIGPLYKWRKLKKMPPDTWLEQLKEWKKEAESTLRLLKKEYNRKFKTEQPAHITITGSISHGYCLDLKIIITWETAETPFNKEDAQRIIEDYLV